MKLINPTDSVPMRPIFLALSGYPGMGKTTASFTAEKPLLFDFDNGVGRSEQTYRCPYYQIGSYAEFNSYVFSDDIANDIKENGFKTVIIDTVGAMLDDYMTAYVVNIDGKFSQKDGSLSVKGWGALQQEFSKVLTRFWALGLDVIGLCHAKEEQGKEDVKTLRLAVKGGSNDIITRKADLIGFCKMSKDKRVIDFRPSEEQIGKNTGNIGLVYIPEVRQTSHKNFMADIVRKTRETMGKLTQAQQDTLAIIEKFALEISKADTLAKLAKIQKEIDAKDKTISVQVTRTSAERYSQIFFSKKELPTAPDKLTEFYESCRAEMDADGITNEAWRKAVAVRISEHANTLGYKYSREQLKFIKNEAPTA